MKQEVQLAKVELKDEVSKVGKGAGMLGGAGFAGWFVLLFLSLALTFLLDNWLPIEVAALITAGLWAVVAAVLALVGPQGAAGGQPAAAPDAADLEGGRAMGQSTEELTSQIEDTRQRMASDLDTLQDRVSPSAIVERRKQAVRGRVSSIKDKVMGTAQSAEDSVVPASSAASSGADRQQRRVDGTGAASRALRWPPASSPSAPASSWPRCCRPAGWRPRPRTGWSRPPRRRASPCSTRHVPRGRRSPRNVKESATDAAQQVKDCAQASAQTVRTRAQSSAGTVRDQASSG